jgi:hypothetical protein
MVGFTPARHFAWMMFETSMRMLRAADIGVPTLTTSGSDHEPARR